MKLGLGTVQFGVAYGISNRSGRTPAGEAARALAVAADLGIRVLDTAPLYGESEAVLGAALPPGHAFRIVTKTPKFPGHAVSPADAKRLREEFAASLRRLGAKRIYGLLAHDADDLLKPGGDLLMRCMLDLRDRGLVERVGASVYTGAQIDALRARYPLGLVQAPVNVLDQRLIRSGRLAALKTEGCEVHARSAFLQGALLMDPQDLPAHFESVRPALRDLRARFAAVGLSPQRGALGFVAGLAEVDTVVCGVNDTAQLVELGTACAPLPPGLDLSGFALEDEAVLNPSRWRT